MSEISKCCKAEVKVANGEDFGNPDDLVTCWYECTKCEKACDLDYPEESNPLEIPNNSNQPSDEEKAKILGMGKTHSEKPSPRLEEQLDLILTYLWSAPKLGLEHAKRKVIAEVNSLLATAISEERKRCAEIVEVLRSCGCMDKEEDYDEDNVCEYACQKVSEAKQKILNPNDTKNE